MTVPDDDEIELHSERIAGEPVKVIANRCLTPQQEAALSALARALPDGWSAQIKRDFIETVGPDHPGQIVYMPGTWDLIVVNLSTGEQRPLTPSETQQVSRALAEGR